MTTQAQPARSRLDPEPVPRRDVLGLVSLGWAAAALLFAAVGMLRLPRAAVLSSPTKKFRVTLPETLAAGEPYIPPGRSVAVFQDAEGAWAVSTVCTHLGCIVRAGTAGFECPCHGSRFAPDGSVTKGPAPRGLPWLAVRRSGDALIVDGGQTVPPGTKV